MKKALHDGIIEHFGVQSWEELWEDAEFTEVIMDSVQPAFCRYCGMCVNECVEPDATDIYCEECDMNSGHSLQMLVLFGG